MLTSGLTLRESRVRQDADNSIIEANAHGSIETLQHTKVSFDRAAGMPEAAQDGHLSRGDKRERKRRESSCWLGENREGGTLRIVLAARILIQLSGRRSAQLPAMSLLDGFQLFRYIVHEDDEGDGHMRGIDGMFYVNQDDVEAINRTNNS